MNMRHTNYLQVLIIEILTKYEQILRCYYVIWKIKYRGNKFCHPIILLAITIPVFCVYALSCLNARDSASYAAVSAVSVRRAVAVAI